MKRIILCLLTLAVCVKTTAFSVITDEGAWCWFADPRALHYEDSTGNINATYIGYIDVHGNIKATQIDWLSGYRNEVLVRSYFQPDDHDNPSFLVLPDKRVLIFYSRHTDEPVWYYRISRKPGDITTLGKERQIKVKDNVTYPSPFILEDDPNHIYMGWRGINWHPTIAQFTLPDANDSIAVSWGPYQIVQSTGARPYCKYACNGRDKIFFTFTTGHPDNEYPNWQYFAYFDVNDKALHDIRGRTLSFVGQSIFNINKTKDFAENYPFVVVDSPDTIRDWGWQCVIDSLEQPVIVLVSINESKNHHYYYYIRWNGKAWRKTFIANGGEHFHRTPGLELCYSAGLIIDPDDPDVIVSSEPADGRYELYKYRIRDSQIMSRLQLTSGSDQNNVRPFIIGNTLGRSPLRLTWMNGVYYDWIVSKERPGYPTAIVTDHALPKVRSLDSYDYHASYNVKLDTAKYSGILVKSGKYTIGLTADGYPYVQIKKRKYVSSNILGTSDVWLTQRRATDGRWPAFSKLTSVRIDVTLDGSALRTYINGIQDQYIEMQPSDSDT